MPCCRYRFHDLKNEVLALSIIQDYQKYEILAQKYYNLATDFCNFIQSKTICDETLDELMTLLMRLYIDGLRLPLVEPDTVKDDLSKINKIPDVYHINIKYPSFYWQIFNPYEHEEAVGGDLQDDLSDIAKDLYDGILEYDAGYVNNAVFGWIWGLNHHWGNHVVNALRALHALRTR